MTGINPKSHLNSLDNCQIDHDKRIVLHSRRHYELSRCGVKQVSDRDLAFLSIAEQKQLIQTKMLSPVELTELYLDRINKLDPKLNAYLTVCHEEALVSAKLAEDAVVQGNELGPLHGIPISIKDLEDTQNIKTTNGSLVYKDRVPKNDSIVVERVRRAGAIILGKTNTPEFGLLGRTENMLGPPCNNPWNTARTSGGSSGGAAAAVASGLCSLATGSDGGGSIRIPSSFCGVYGIKPTQYRVPSYQGVDQPFIRNLFSQSGPIGRSVRDCALLLQVLSGHDYRDPSSIHESPEDYLEAANLESARFRIGWSADFGYAPIDNEVLHTTFKSTKVFESLGSKVDEVDISLGNNVFDSFWTLFSASVFAKNPNLLTEHCDELTDYSRESFQYGASITGAKYSTALGEIEKIKALFKNIFESYDLIITPTTAVTAFPHGNPPDRINGQLVNPFWGYLPHTYPINMIGNPAASIPCGFSPEGLPIGIQIIGKIGDESSVISASAAFENTQPWIHQRPIVS